MGGKRRAQPSGNAQGKPAATGDAAKGGVSGKRQRPGLRVQAAAGSAGARSSGLEESGSILAPMTICISMRGNPNGLAALEAVLRNAATAFGGREFRVEWTRVGSSEDTLQRVLSLVLGRVGPDRVLECFQTCKAWRSEMEDRGFCHKTFRLCSLLAVPSPRANLERLAHNALQRLNASTNELERVFYLDVNAFLQRWWGRLGAYRAGSLHQSLQAASQEPDASFLSQGASSTSHILGLQLVQWLGRPQARFPGICTLDNHSGMVSSVSFSHDGTRIASGSMCLTLWDAATGAEVRSHGGLTDENT